jgi:hypothetical protein
VAIAFVAKGTTAKVDTTVSGPNVNVSLPAGHASGHLLLLFATSDDNTNTLSDPPGWTRLFYITNGTSVGTPYTPRMRTKCYYRIDNGALGSTVTLNFDTGHPWPTANPSVLAYCEAYSGCDTTGPIERWSFTATTSTAAAMAHPQVTTATTNAWLISFRTVSSDPPGATFTCSVGTDAERQDDVDSINELSCATYDSNVALAAGLQTQRTTTASRAATYGGLAVSIVIKPASTATAVFATAGTAALSLAARDPGTDTEQGAWDLCAPGGLPTYDFAIDWAGDGSYASPGDQALTDVISDITMTYGRDQQRQLNPAAVGSASFSVVNADRQYSPEWSTSPLFGNLEPARPMRGQVTWSGTTFPLFLGRIDDFNIKADRGDRSVDFTFLDALNDLSQIQISTPVYQAMRTGDLINTILDTVGWTAGRSLDLGATYVKYWWAEGTDALTAIGDLVRSEGAPSIAFVAPDGTFVFHDRHHRIQHPSSTDAQGTYAQPALFDCAAPAVTGFGFTEPFTYAHGWRDIVNSVRFDVSERRADDDLSVIWSTEDTLNLTNGQSQQIQFSGSDPFLRAVVPVQNTDYTSTGSGVLQITLDRDSGASATLTLTAIGGTVNVQNLQVRAYAVPVQRNTTVTRTDPGSISVHGERAYPDGAPWAGVNDAYDIAGAILLRYAQRRPTVEMRVVTQDPDHFVQVLSRTVGDRIHIVNGEMGLDDDFFIERITQTVSRINAPGRPPVHSVVFGCEKALVQQANPFRFDVRGAGFDQGVFDPIQGDGPFTTFMFDDPVNGVFDYGQYGT